MENVKESKETTTEEVNEQVNKNELPRSLAEKKIQEKENKKNKRIARCRPLKNFFFWLLGVLSSVGIVLSSVFIGLKVVPLSTIVGKDNLDGVVSEDVYNSSMIDVMLNFNSYTLEDFPVLQESLNQAMDGKELGILSEYQAVETPTLEPTTINGVQRYALTEGADASMYYYSSQDVGGVAPFSASQEVFVPAFDDDGLLLESLSQKVANGEDIQLYYPPLTSFPVTKALGKIGEYIMLAPVSDVLSIVGVGEGTFVNEIFEGIFIGDFTKTPEQGGFSLQMVLDRLTLDSLGGAELLGDLGNFEFFKEFAPVEELPLVEQGFITKEGENFTSNPALYYMLVVNGEGDQAKYARAFTDEGEFITKYYLDQNGKVVTTPVGDQAPVLQFDSFNQVQSGQLRFANLAKIPVSQTFELLGESITRQTINGMFNGLGVTVDDNSLISELFGSYTLEDFTKDPSEGGFDINTIQLTKILGEVDEENAQLYDLLCSVVSTEPITPEQLTIGHLLGGFSFDNIVVGDFIELDKDTLDLLCSAINPAKQTAFEQENPGVEYVEVTSSTLTIGDLKYFNQNDIKISIILGEYLDNQKLYDVILSAKGLMPERDGKTDAEYLLEVKSVAQSLSVNALSGLDVNNISLTVVLPETENQALYNILLEALTITEKDDVTIKVNPTASDIRLEHFNGFTANKIKLSSVIPLPSQDNNNQILYSILSQATGGIAFEALTVGDFNNFDLHNVKLSTVLDPAEDPGLYQVLVEIYPNKDVINDLTIADLANFDVSGVRLGTVLPQSTNPEIYKVFGDALNLGQIVTVDGQGNPVVLPAIQGSSDGEKLSKVTLHEIEYRLDIKHIHLATVLELEPGQSTGNSVLDALLKDNVTVGDISSAMNDMSLFSVYGDGCFVLDKDAQGQKFTRTEENGVVTYELNANGEYVVNENAGIWLLLCFDAEQVDENGRTIKYVSSNLTMGTLQTNGASISQRIVASTIRQLADAGIVDDSGFQSQEIYKLTISEVLQKLDDVFSNQIGG